MERAGTLSTLRGDSSSNKSAIVATSSFKDKATSVLPQKFIESVPENAQRLILRCVDRNPKRRPSAQDLLVSELLPRKIELEQKYLEEALEILTSDHSDSQAHILEALFRKPTREVVDITFDTDISVKANTAGLAKNGKRTRTPSESLLSAISSIRAGAVDIVGLSSLAMNATSLIAATAAFNRARLAGRVKGGKAMQKRATQRTAGILAMRAATAAAVTGAMDGVHGADPLVVENVCEALKQIFANHGAVHLKTPLLRPRPNSAKSLISGGPAELLNSRGVVLNLPEDLTSSFARSVGRGGAATANLKRYDIDRVYHRSLAGGHPRESLVASFDVVQEDHQKAKQIQAEVILVTQQVISMLRSPSSDALPFDAESPLWYLRLGHTRLTDIILDICNIPPREGLRKYVLDLLSHFSAPSPYVLTTYEHTGDVDVRDRGRRDEINKRLSHAVSAHDMPREAARKMELLFMESPLSPRAGDGVLYLQRTLSKLRYIENESNPKRLKRYEDAARNLKVLSDLVFLLEFHLQPHFSRAQVGETRYSRPLFISIDLGLRQRRRTYHGGVVFEAIVLPSNYFSDQTLQETNDELVMTSGRGMKVASGGDFSELVRKNRPPGNFAQTVVHSYTTSPIPFCFGVSFGIGKLVELLYVDAGMDHLEGVCDAASASDIIQMRRLLGHPLANAPSVDCLVASTSGMDSSCLMERFQVCSRLWSDGVAAEYLAHSGIMLSLLRRVREDSEPSNLSDWSLTELFGVCSLLNIPFVIIVQSHLLRDKNSVRLVRVAVDSSGQTSESFVSLENLPNVILGDFEADHNTSERVIGSSPTPQSQSNLPTATRTSCIFIEQDSYFGGDRGTSRSDTPHWKTITKTMKRIEFEAESFLSTFTEDAGKHGIAVFAVADASFWALRDFGTNLMKSESQDLSANGAYLETAKRYPQFKRSLKTLSVALDNYMRRQGHWTPSAKTQSSSTSTSSLFPVLLYSKKDDRFDLVTLSLQGAQPKRK